MGEIEEILCSHLARYPQMELVDAVKLLFQSEFGGGHMIANPAKSLAWIRQEWANQPAGMAPERDAAGRSEQMPYGQTASVLEAIGGGICRLYLSALEEGFLPETLNQMFVQTADRKIGRRERFEQKLEALVKGCEQGIFPFDPAGVRAYLDAYRAQGYPPVSHSSAYRDAYHPAYRVVAECYARYYPVFLAIDRALVAAEGRQVVVAVDGMCGSGKSTLGRLLAEVYDCNLLHMDDFFLRPEQRTEARLAETGGNVDYERFQEEVLAHLADPGGFSYQVFDCSVRRLGRVVRVPYKQLNIIEGAYSQHPYFGDVYDLRFYYGIDPQEQESRILKRNGPAMLERFRNEWIPMEMKYLETYQIKEHSMIV